MLQLSTNAGIGTDGDGLTGGGIEIAQHADRAAVDLNRTGEGIRAAG